jgi:branched-chain amino acid transport system ATP-binding protein
MDIVIKALKANDMTILFVEHDMEIIGRFADRVLAFFPQGWQLILGGVLLATIMFFPNGIGALVTSQKRPGLAGAPRRAAS